MSTKTFSLLPTVSLLRKWHKPVLWAMAFAAVASTIVAWLIPVQYKSTTVFYATNPRAVDPERIFEGQKIDLATNSQDIDRIITIGESQLVAEHILQQFDLVRRYDIDTTDNEPYWDQALKKFWSRYSIKSTNRDAMEIIFYDNDRDTAALVANAIVQKIDQVNQDLTYENRNRVVQIYEGRYRFFEKKFLQLQDSLVNLRRKHNIYNQERQIRELTRQITEAQARLSSARGELKVYMQKYPAGHTRITELQAIISGQKEVLRSLSQSGKDNIFNLEDFAAAADQSAQLSAQFLDMQGRYIGSKSAYENTQLALQGKVSSVYTIQRAVPALSKAKPVRWLIVLGSIVLTLVLCLVLIWLHEVYIPVWRHSQS